MGKIEIMFRMEIDSEIQSEFSAIGKMENDQLTFSDPVRNSYRIQLNKDEIHLHRSGEEELAIVFTRDKKSGGILKTSDFEFALNLYTNQLDVSTSKLELDYDLLDGNKQVSNHRMLVRWNHKTEGND